MPHKGLELGQKGAVSRWARMSRLAHTVSAHIFQNTLHSGMLLGPSFESLHDLEKGKHLGVKQQAAHVCMYIYIYILYIYIYSHPAVDRI